MANHQQLRSTCHSCALVEFATITIMVFIAMTGKYAKAENCPIARELPRSIDAQSYYADSAGSKPDPAREASNRASVWPTRKALIDLAHITDAVVTQAGPNGALCARDRLVSWAESGALREPRSLQSRYETTRIVAGLSLAYAKVRPVLGDADQRLIEDWLLSLARTSVQLYRDNPNWRNNLYYWSALTAASVHFVTRDAQLGAYAMEALTYANIGVAKDGSMPTELKRKSRARGYHLHALKALFVAQEVMRASRANITTEIEKTSERLLNYVVTSFCDPTHVETESKAIQERTSPDFAWLSVGRNGFAAVQQADCSINIGPTFDEFLGGDTRVLARVLSR